MSTVYKHTLILSMVDSLPVLVWPVILIYFCVFEILFLFKFFEVRFQVMKLSVDAEEVGLRLEERLLYIY